MNAWRLVVALDGHGLTLSTGSSQDECFGTVVGTGWLTAREGKGDILKGGLSWVGLAVLVDE